MADYLTREFRSQLTSTMDSVLRRAMFEITKIFENSLHDHQLELVQKGEEIVQLKIKLQRAEVKLRDAECGGGRGMEMNNTQVNEAQKEPEDVQNASEQTSDVPEIDFEVPDDWCAPLGCETARKQDEGTCPSVRLRPLYIPLWPVPIVKQEAVSSDINSNQGEGRRKSKRGSSLNEKDKQTQDRSLPVSDQRARRRPVRKDIEKLLLDIKRENTDLTGGIGLRRRVRNLTGNGQENTSMHKKEERKIATPQSESTEQEQNDSGKTYTCKFCQKIFDTPFGRSVHVRSHKRCRGCRKEFPFPSALRSHKRYCLKLKKLLAKQAQSADPSKSQPCDEEKPNTPNKKQAIAKEESAPSSSHHSEPFIQNDGATKKYSCAFCNKSVDSRCRLKEHERVHTGEKPFPCSFCPKTFRIRQSRKHHIMRMHIEHVNEQLNLQNSDLAWTKPIEMTEDSKDDVIRPSKDEVREQMTCNNIQRERKPGFRASERWQTMGTQCTYGFTCLLCQKVIKDKYLLIEHFRTHTGEKPLKCQKCPAKFRSRGQLSIHKKRCCAPAVQCEKCGKKFPSQTRLNKHMLKHHRDWPNLCKVCGKGFVTEGRLRNHLERYHEGDRV